MNDFPPATPPTPPPAAEPVAERIVPPPAPSPAGEPRSRPSRSRLALWLTLAAVAVGAAVGGWALRQELVLARTQLEQGARALAAADEVAAQRARDAQLRVERLESEVSRLRDQRAELDQLYLDLTRGRDETALVEVERLVTLASQELQISGSVPTALAALQGADARLARIDRPQLVNLRRAITRDIERLRAAPTVDLTGMALKIDQIAQSVDGLPLLAEAAARPAAPAAKGKVDAKAASKAVEPATADTWWTQTQRWLQREFGDLVRIREVDTPEALLLTGAQQQLVRQQLKLRLLNARQALLMRNDRLYRADLASAQELLARYFDAQQSATAGVQAQLKQLAGAALSVEVPQIADSVAAVAALRGGKPGGR